MSAARTGVTADSNGRRRSGGHCANSDAEAGAGPQRAALPNLCKRKTPRGILSFVFDRLYVLRNQIVHGGSTWNSAVNRKQVRDGAAILGFVMPVFVDVMMDNPREDWGWPFYPVVE